MKNIKLIGLLALVLGLIGCSSIETGNAEANNEGLDFNAGRIADNTVEETEFDFGRNNNTDENLNLAQNNTTTTYDTAYRETSSQEPAPQTHHHQHNQANNSDLPPAKPGQCFARVSVPPVFRNVAERVLVKEEGQKVTTIPGRYETVKEKVVVQDPKEIMRVIPATYKKIKEKVMIEPPKQRLVRLPAEYKTINKKLLVRPARTEWKQGEGPIQKLDASTGEILCLVEIPAEYKTIKQKVLVHPERTVTKITPAKYKYVSKTVVDQPAQVKKQILPAKYAFVDVKKEVEKPRSIVTRVPAQWSSITKKELVSPASTRWEEILCKTNTSGDVVRKLQSSLKAKGYNPGPVDGDLGQQTLSAVDSFQRDQGLSTGGLTLETLKRLDVVM